MAIPATCEEMSPKPGKAKRSACTDANPAAFTAA
jgi:hypothetical protein